MSKKRPAPYREGSSYGKIFAAIVKAPGQIVTGIALKRFPVADVGVVLSPRPVSENQSDAKPGQVLSDTGRGDCRGNFSSAGHLYAMERLPRKVGKDGKKEEQRMRLRWRSPALDPLKRPADEVPASKTRTKAKAAKPKARSRRKAPAKK